MTHPRDRRPPPSLGTLRPGTSHGHGDGRQPVGRAGYPPPPPPLRPAQSRPQAQFHPDEDDRPSFAWKLFRRATLSLLGIVLLLVLAAGAILLFPPTGIVRDQLISEVKQKTGRDLVISGPVSMRLLPSVAVSFKDVTLSAPPAMPGPALLRTDELALELNLMPLLMREIAIKRLVLRRPIVDLRVDRNGRRSWDFAAAGDLRDDGIVRYAQSAPRGPDGRALPKELQDFVRNSADTATGRRKLSSINDLSLGDVRILEGRVRYVDERAPQPIEVTGIDARLSLSELSGPLTANGAAVHAGERVAFDVRLTSLRSLLDEQPVKLTGKLTSKPAELIYDGTLTTAGTPAIDGRMDVKAPSLDGLSRLLRLPVSGLDPLGALAFGGQVKLSGTSLMLTGSRLALGETTAAGSMTVDLPAGQRPQIKANLKLAALDLDRLTGIEPVFAAPARGGPAAPSGQPGPSAKPRDASAPAVPAPPAASRFAPPPPAAGSGAPASSIEDLLARPDPAQGAPSQSPTAPRDGTAVRGYTRRAGEGWSSEPINPAPLRLVDLDGRFEIESLSSGKLRIGATQVAAILKAGVLKLDVPQLDLYGGRAKILLNIDVREPELTIGANISGDGVAALALMQAISDVDFIDGRGRLVLAVSAKGGSERELIGTLAGKADLRLTDGALIGWDASQMIGGLGQGRIPKLDRAPGSRTPFSEVSGTFQIANGVARNQDLKVESPAVRASGSGLVNLVDRNINMLIKPQVTGAGGIEVPLRIAGPLDKVSVVPDVGAVLKSPQAQEAVKKLRDGDVDGALRDVLGGGQKADEKVGKAKELLKQFLGR